MIETINTQPVPQVTNLDIDSWLENVNELGVYDKPFVHMGDNGPETVMITDAVIRADLDEQGQRIGATPIVRLQHENGKITDLPIKDLLSQGSWMADFTTFKKGKAARAQKEYWQKKEAEEKRWQEAQIAKQEARAHRNRRLFAPLLRPGDDDKEAQKRYDSFVTEAARQQATDELRTATTYDYKLRAIVDDYKAKNGLTNLTDVVDALRTDAALRLRAGEYFFDKINKIGYHANMPRRVAIDDEKRPTKSLSPVQHLKSREYAALLCLAKVDGSFNQAMAENIYGYDENGVATHAQHRTAADLVLREPVIEEVHHQHAGKSAVAAATGNYDHLFAA
ncbi:MAG TPA: hypothetical protein VHB51_04130 [Candidatus Saccharimonadales bacterium]|nr:hypothetical protein [Candidatus Saccharimonadales bacterium]